MAEEDLNKIYYPSLPSNYVSIVQLQEQWLKKKHNQKQEAEQKQKQFEKNQEIGAEKQIRHTQKHQSQENCVKNCGIGEKSNLGRFDRPGYSQRRWYNQDCEKGVYKDKGKGKIGEVDSVLHWGEESGDFDGCGGDGVVMSLCVEAVEEDEIVGEKKGDDWFRGGLVGNVGDLCVNYDVLGNLGKMDTIVEAKEGSERGKKVDDGGMRVGDKRSGLLRSSGGNKGVVAVNFGDSDYVGRREGVEEEEVLEGKDDVGLSDQDVVSEVVNVEHRSRWGYKKNRNKMGLSRSDFGRDAEQGQGNGREENGIQLDLKENGEKNGEEMSGDNVGNLVDMGVAIEVRKVEQKSRGRYKKNRNKKGLSGSEFGGGTEQGQGTGRGKAEENGIQLDSKKENGENNVGERGGDNIGDVVNMRVETEVREVEQKTRGGYKKNRNKKGRSESEFGRGTEQGRGNGRGKGEENGIQLDLKQENCEKNGDESGDNIGDVVDMEVANEARKVEQKTRGGNKKNRNKKGLSRSEFGRSTEQGQGNGKCKGEENGIQLDLNKKNGEKNGESGDNVGDGEDVAEKVSQLEKWKHNRVTGLRRNVNMRMMDRTTSGYMEWVVKGARAGANIIKNTVGEKSRTDESVVESPFDVSEINEGIDLCSDESQRNDCDNTVNGEFQDKAMENKNNQKQELFGDHEDKCLLMTNEANGESARFRDKTKGNWHDKGFSREKIRRDFKELSLNIQRVGYGRKNGQTYGQNMRFQKNPRSGDMRRNSGLVWVKKGGIADADVSES